MRNGWRNFCDDLENKLFLEYKISFFSLMVTSILECSLLFRIPILLVALSYDASQCPFATVYAVSVVC